MLNSYQKARRGTVPKVTKKERTLPVKRVVVDQKGTKEN